MKSKILIISVTIICSVSAISCGQKKHNENSGQSATTHAQGQDEIVIEPDDAKEFGIETQAVGLTRFNNIIRVSGQIVNSSTDEATITATVPGIIEISKNLIVGSPVNARSTVASISTKRISGGDPNESARVAIANAKRQLDRLEPLLKEGIVTRREYDEALAAYNSAKAAYTPGASGAVSSPISGVVTQIFVSSGQYVETGAPIATVSRGNTLVLRADLPEKYRSMLPQISSANFRTSYGDQWISIDSMGGKRTQVAVGDALAQSGYIPVYFTLRNDGTLSSGSYADVCLISESGTPSIVVPTVAITEQQGNYFVYIKKGDHSYEKRKIDPGDSNGPGTQIRSGLSEGDILVTKGATMVKLAESSGTVPEGHSHNH